MSGNDEMSGSPMADVDQPRLYVENSIAALRSLDLLRLPLADIAEEMNDPSVPTRDDWVGWRPVPSTVTDEDLDFLEREIGTAFPPPYRRFLQSYHFYELFGFSFCRHPIHTWRADLRALHASYPNLIAVGLVPFGAEGFMDAGPACFDSRVRSDDGDCPVVFWDHDWAGTAREVGPLFSGSASMFRCLSVMAQSRINFVYHDLDEGAEELLLKKELMRQFLSLDADGAGGAAREYWTGWGVDPGNET